MRLATYRKGWPDSLGIPRSRPSVRLVPQREWLFRRVSGTEEEAFYRFTGDELAHGMSGGPVLVGADGAVNRPGEGDPGEGTDLGGLLTPMRGLWTLAGGAEAVGVSPRSVPLRRPQGMDHSARTTRAAL